MSLENNSEHDPKIDLCHAQMNCAVPTPLLIQAEDVKGDGDEQSLPENWQSKTPWNQKREVENESGSGEKAEKKPKPPAGPPPLNLLIPAKQKSEAAAPKVVPAKFAKPQVLQPTVVPPRSFVSAGSVGASEAKASSHSDSTEESSDSSTSRHGADCDYDESCKAFL